MAKRDPERDQSAVHEFLISPNRGGGLSEDAEAVPVIREYIDGLPKTAATFKLVNIDGIDSQRVSDRAVEFCGAWPHPDHFTSNGKARRYVNPGYKYSHRYSDLVVECGCGAVLTRNYEDGKNALRDEHNHEDGCKPYHRLEARAEMGRKRETVIRRLYRLGWEGAEMADRFGIGGDSVTKMAQSYGIDPNEARAEYRGLAGNTYKWLVHRGGVKAADVAEVYGVALNTMRRRYSRDGDPSAWPEEAVEKHERAKEAQP